VASGTDRGTDRLGTAKVSNSWGSGRCRLRRAPCPGGLRALPDAGSARIRRAPCPGGLQALPDAGSARTLPRWAAGETPVRRGRTKAPDRHFGDQNARQNLGHPGGVATTTECRSLGKYRKTRSSTSYSLQDCPLSERSSPKSFRHKRLSHARSGCRELSLGSRLRRDSTQLHNDPNGTMWRSRAMVLTWKGNRVGWFIDHALQLVGLRGLWSVRGPDLLLPGQGPVFWVVSGRSFM
jgi:hypothetical protein